ncbi:MAG: ABC transporter permease [Steroidobacteraceae bacterium]
MLRHYLMMAARNLARHKLYTIINVLGLSVALTCVIFVILFVRYQLSYDKWVPGTQDLYRVELTIRVPGGSGFSGATGPYPLGTAMRDQLPGVTGMTRLRSANLTLTHGDRQYLEKNVDFVDSNFFTLIRLPFVEGSPDTALSQPESVVLSESAAKEYFGNTDPMGRTLITNSGSCPDDETTCSAETVSLRVTGVVRDLPQNTQLTGNAFIPIGSLADRDPPSQRQQWFYTRPFTYIRLAPGVEPAAILAAMPRILDQDVTGVLRKVGIAWRGSQAYRIHLTPFTQVHLSSSRWPDNLTPPGSWNTLYGVVIIGILILLVACFNFINLATARATLRAREIGLRKTVGATRRQLTFQFLSEAVFLALLSLVCAIAAAEILLSAFNGFLHQSITLHYASDWRLDLILIGVAAGAGLVSGIYPALVLSRLRPVAALQTKTGGSRTSVGLRDVLVLMQFAVSIGLGIAAIVVFRQVDYARNMDLGFRRNNIVVIQNSDLAGKRQQAFAEALRVNRGIRQVGLSLFAPFTIHEEVTTLQVPGQPSQLTFSFVPIGLDYPRTYGIALAAGRLLSASRGDDEMTNRRLKKGTVNLLVNVAGARRLGFTPQNAVGRTIGFGDDRVHIVGVLADAKVRGAREPVRPTVYAYAPGNPMEFSVRLRPGRIPQTLAFIDQTWHDFLPTVAIQRSFLSASFDELYRSDERQGTVFGVFVIIAVFIACLGLYGFVVFTSERRTKEVAVRKISGAHTLDILRIMLWRISVPVLLANLIAWPVTYYYLRRWLEGFANHIWLNPAYFLAGGAVALLIACMTVFAHALRLARASPIYALRYE